MARKVFISFLGTSNYVQVHYKWNDDYQSAPVRFIQEALVDRLCADWTANDVILVFRTMEATRKNWEDNGHSAYLGKEHDNIEERGLKDILKAKKIPAKIIDDASVMISEGFSLEEIWGIFVKVYAHLQQKDEIYLDVTHAFRSIPLFATVLLNYASFLKNIRIKSVLYGAFEKLGPGFEVKKIPLERRIAPVLDLLPLIELQRWTSAASDFIRFGDAFALSEMTKDVVTPVLVQTEGKEKGAAAIRDIGKNLFQLSDSIKTNRGRCLIAAKNAIKIMNGLATLKENQFEIKPLAPILKRIEDDVKPLAYADRTNNLIEAVEWCIAKNLVQEGLTILEEFIITFFAESISNNSLDKEFRELISVRLQHPDDFDSARVTTEKNTLASKIESHQSFAKFTKIFIQIAETRNDINHAGMTQNPMQAANFRKKLIEFLNQTRNIFFHQQHSPL
jgi:CRISPR-associated Csx2 family protein